ncbi:MAG: hypothetical protein HY272_04845 [Gammaproteobacteria bacterium]|nr:hypothetical protein [Gammaproteobacteria bacterium]
MIRGIAIFLLTLNLGYLAWNMLTPPPQVPVTADSEPYYGTRLMLLAERVISLPGAQTNGGTGSGPLSPHPEPAPSLVSPATEPAKVAEVPPLVPQVRAPESVTKVEPKPEIKPVVTPPPPPPVRSKPKACYAVGPFYLVGDVGRAAAVFEKEGVSAQQRAAAERKQAGFWVYIPPRPTLQEAREVLRTLKEKDIYDALIIAEGEKQNSISVGVYHVEPQAKQRQDEIKVLGYKAVVEPLYRTQPQYWLDLELKDAREIPVKPWNKVREDFPGISQSARKCD